jgi:23S rRNA G2069 N7-methylase RlmK/C1962 C5-methylase RlmI
MFTWINKQGVRSDRGFVVQRTGRFSMEYTEGGKVLKLSVEDGAGSSIFLDRRSMRSWYGEWAEIPESDRLRIVQNIREALEFQGLRLDI